MDVLELGLWVAVSHHLISGNQNWVLCKSNVSPAPMVTFLLVLTTSLVITAVSYLLVGSPALCVGLVPYAFMSEGSVV